MPTDEAGLHTYLAAHPNDPAALSLLSKILWNAHRYEEGAALLEAAHAATPALPEELLWALALHEDALGHTEIADSIATSLEGHVSDWSRDGSAATFLRLRRDGSAEAEAMARKAVDAEPSAANQNNLGIALLYAGKPEEARKSFLAANAKDPHLPGPLYNLAIVDQFYLFDEASARTWFDKYRTLSKDDPDGLAAALAVKVATDAPHKTEAKP
jgi:tetratricopeptide (TPR) repeat protein